MARLMRRMWWAAPAAALAWWWTRNRRGQSSLTGSGATTTSEYDTDVRRDTQIRGSLGASPSGSGSGITAANTAFSTQGPAERG